MGADEEESLSETMGKTEVNLDDHFEVSRQCATTRTTTRPFYLGALQRACSRGATRGRCESGARRRRRQCLPSRQGRLHWFRGPVYQQSGTGREVPTDHEAPGQENAATAARVQKSQTCDMKQPREDWPREPSDLNGRAGPRCTNAMAWKPLETRPHRT